MRYTLPPLLALACLCLNACSRIREGEADAVKDAKDAIPHNLRDHVVLKEIKRHDRISKDKRHVTIALTPVIASKEPLYRIVGYDGEIVGQRQYWSDTEPAIIELKHAPGETFELAPINVLGNKLDAKWVWQLDAPFHKEWFSSSQGRTRSACPAYCLVKDSEEHKAFINGKADRHKAQYEAKRQSVLDAYEHITAGMQGSGQIRFGKITSRFLVKVLSIEGSGQDRVMELEVIDQHDNAKSFHLKTIARGNDCFLRVEYLSGSEVDAQMMTVSPEKGPNQIQLVFQRSGTLDKYPIFLN